MEREDWQVSLAQCLPSQRKVVEEEVVKGLENCLQLSAVPSQSAATRAKKSLP